MHSTVAKGLTMEKACGVPSETLVSIGQSLELLLLVAVGCCCQRCTGLKTDTGMNCDDYDDHGLSPRRCSRLARSTAHNGPPLITHSKLGDELLFSQSTVGVVSFPFSSIRHGSQRLHWLWLNQVLFAPLPWLFLGCRYFNVADSLSPDVWLEPHKVQ